MLRWVRAAWVALFLASLNAPAAVAQGPVAEPTQPAAPARAPEGQDVTGWVPLEDAASRVADPVTLPDAPDDYVSETRGNVEWTFPASATSVIRELQGQYANAWERVVSDFGGTIEDEVTIRVGLTPEEMHALAPVGHPAPDYAAGVAYPRFGVILLTLQAPDSWERPNIEKVLTHELSHIALYRAVGGHHLPRWFVEGVAVQQAGENDLNRIKTLWQAEVAGNVVPLADLDGSFPRYAHRVSVAYAQSADIIAHMRRADSDTRRFRSLLRKVREEGMTFEESFFDSYEMSLATMEREWRERLAERFQTIPLVVTGGGLWVFASILLLMAYVRRRRQHHAALERMAEEEAARDAAIDRAEGAVLAEIARQKARQEARDAAEHIVIVKSEAGLDRDSGVPTVSHDGSEHTLH